MTQQTFQEYSSTDKGINFKKLFGILSTVLIFIVGITVFQDFLESNRGGYFFYFINYPS